MALFHNYDPQRVVGSFRGIPFLAYMDGTFLTVARTEDAFTPQVGATGDVTRVRSRDRSGTVTLTLQAASPSNTLLSAVAAEDELFGTGFGPLMIKDLNGDTLVQAEVAWIQKLPDTEFSDEASGREWVFACAELFMHVGSGTVL